MKDKKGQALIEFILILPIFLFILLGTFDFGNIFYQRYQLEDKVEELMELYKQNKITEIDTYINQDNIVFKYEKENNKINFIITKEIKINTPGLDLILGSPYRVTISRSLYE